MSPLPWGDKVLDAIKVLHGQEETPQHRACSHSPSLPLSHPLLSLSLDLKCPPGAHMLKAWSNTAIFENGGFGEVIGS
jgi:hypothetical protein